MRNIMTGAVAVCCLGVLSTLAPSAHGQFEQAVQWVPSGANSIVMVRAKDILDTPIAKAQNWRSLATRAFKSETALLPPSTDRLLIAAEIDYEFSEPMWQVSVFESAEKVSDIVKISERLGGTVETIGGKDALELPGDSHLVKIDDKTLVARYPANRQTTSRWIRSGKGLGNKLSPYLQTAVQYADNNAHIIVAFDLKDVVSMDEIKKRLQSRTALQGDALEKTAESLASIRGLQLGITITDKINGAIKIDFDGSTEAIADNAKDILLNVLQDHGLMLQDFKSWTPEILPQQVTVTGAISEAGFRQLTSFIEQPLSASYTSEYADGAGSDMKTRTLQYFTAIQDTIASVRKIDVEGLQSKSKWLSRFSLQIDKLPVLNVDEAALDYGRYVSDTLRDMSGGMTNAAYKGMTGRQSVPDEYVGVAGNDYYGRYREYSYMNAYKNRDQARATNTARAQGNMEAKAMLDEIDAATVKLKQDLTAKYQIEF